MGRGKRERESKNEGNREYGGKDQVRDVSH